MRFMIVLKYGPEGEDAATPTPEYFEEMSKFNEQLVDAGVMLAGEGLHPSEKGSVVRFSKGKTTVVDGPFAETKELLAGFWIWKVDSREEAIEWVKRIPMPAPDTETEIEVRQVFETEDFSEDIPAELLEREDRLRERIEKAQP